MTLRAEGATDTLAVFRHRTLEGVVLSLPESADELVPWGEIEQADLCLATGRLLLRFRESFVRRSHWLGGASGLEGIWTDRRELRRSELPCA